MRAALLLSLALLACGGEPAEPSPARTPPDGMIVIPGGTSHLGGAAGDATTMPPTTATLAPFFLDRTPVTVAAFRAFARARGHVTVAEARGGSVIDLATGAWRIVQGATWEHPLGDGSAARDDEPVTQVAWDDAVSFCEARGARLPTELEWEHAARNARDTQTLYPWGDDPRRDGRWGANVWQGAFPSANTLEDGYLFASPVGAFPPTPLGLVDLVGNVWQWTSTEADDGHARVMRGGSFLCDARVCHGYRVSARQTATPDSALMHVGFRCAGD